jgi:hypothetical protein
MMRSCLEMCEYACSLSAICTCMEVAVPDKDIRHVVIAASSLISSVPRPSRSTGDVGSREKLSLIVFGRIGEREIDQWRL